MKTFKRILFVIGILLAAVSCKDENNYEFSISWQSSDRYTVETVSKSLSGERIQVKVTTQTDDWVVSAVEYNTEKAEFVSSDGNTYLYEFVMPSENVILKIQTVENPSYPITWNESESYVLETVSEAKVSETVTVRIVPAEEVEIHGLSYNDQECTLVSSEAGELIYSFTMPAQAVALTVDYTGPASVYNISAQDSPNKYRFNVARTAEEGALVKFTMTFMDQSIKVLQVAYGKGYNDFCEPLAEEVGDEETVYTFEFTMPGQDVVLTPAIEKNWHRIYRVSAPHSEVKALNCLMKDEQGNPITDEDGSYICRNVKGEMFHFIVNLDLGYEADITVTGESGKGYGYGPAVAPDYGSCYGIVMPNEAITVESKTREKEDYKDKPFVGTYQGVFIDVLKGGSITSTAVPNAIMELKYNTVFTVMTTDVNNFNFSGTYVFNEADNTFKYNHEDCGEYALSGSTGNEFNLFKVNNKLEDKPEHTRFYLTSREAASNYVCASNSSANEALIEAETGSGKLVHYLFKRSSYSVTQVELQFAERNSIGENGAVAFFTDQTTGVSYKYTVENNAPVFAKAGKEAGAYAPEAGKEADLILDGFGTGTYKGEEGTYTAQGTIVDFTTASDSYSFVLDFTNKTYTMTGGDGVWDGPTEFYVEGNFGMNYDKERNASVRVKLNLEENKATFVVQLGDEYGISMGDIVHDNVGFAYDSDSQTLTLSQVLMGDGTAWGTGRTDVQFNVSSDKRTLTFKDRDYIYSTSTSKKYITVTGLEVPAL